MAVKLLLGPAAGQTSPAAAAEAALAPDDPITARLRDEASMLSGLRHPNLATFVGFVPRPPALVFEYCPHGSLQAGN